MAKHTNIDWAESTWNPFYGCTKISIGCENCYSELWHKRCGRDFNSITIAKDNTFNAPFKWKEPKKIFVCSLGDFFHKDIPMDKFFDAIEIIEKCSHHTFIILTKRPENIKERLDKRWGKGYPNNVWLGVTAENQEQANKRIPILLNIKANVKFVSYEPALGPIDLTHVPPTYQANGNEYNSLTGNGIDLDGVIYAKCSKLSWVICGCESGGKARAMNLDWARSLRDQCEAANVPFFLKQAVINGKKIQCPILDNKQYLEYPLNK